MGKKYRVKDSQTGRTITFTWNGDTDPTDNDLADVFASAKKDTIPPLQTAQASSTLPSQNARPQAQAQSPGVFQQLLNSMGNVAPRLPQPVRQNPTGAALDMPASVTPLQKAEGIGTALEIGLPFLAAGLSGGASIPAMGGLTGAGTLAKQYLMEGYGGAPQTSTGDKLKEAGVSAAFGAGGQALGVGAGKALQKVAAPMSKYVEPGSLEFAKRSGIDYFPSEVLKESGVGPSLMQGGERVFGSTITGGAVMNPVRTGRMDKILDFAKSELDRVITSLDDPSTVKKIAEGGLESATKTFNNEANKLYREVGNLSKNSQVNTSMVKRFANGVLRKIPEAERIAAGKAGAEATGLVQQLQRVAELPDNIPFEQAQFYRSQLLAATRDAGPIANEVVGSAKKLSQIIDSRMRVSAQQGGFLPAYESANKFYKEGIEKFHNTLIKKLVDTDPEQLGRELLKPRSGISAKEIRGAVGEQAFQKIKRTGIQDWIDDAVKFEASGKDEYTWGKGLLDKWKKLGPETRGVLFSPKEQSEVSSIFESVANFNTKRQPPGLWGMGQIMAGGGAAAVGSPATTAGVFLTPYVFGKLVTSPRGRTWLTEGFKIRPGTTEAIRFSGRFAAWLANENRKESNP